MAESLTDIRFRIVAEMLADDQELYERVKVYFR